ncbi:MAG: Hsp33 family molecular chaperone HslO [Hyphomicrobium sp.]|nr:Hsp33 family molecular chaperone HslO [Hyphomicrobium sp.]
MADVGATTTTLKIPSDDIVLPFRTVRSGVIGRLVRLGPAVDEILSHHAAPNAVSQTLGEAVALTALLGTALKIDGKLTLQTKTDGLLDFLVVTYEPPGRLRAYARYDKKRVGAEEDIPHEELIGSGHLAITIDPGEEMERYQGIVALTGEGVGEAALTYFHQSEQLPSFVRLAVARYQPSSLPGLHLGPVHVCDYAQLAPERTATLTRPDDRHARIIVTGAIGLPTLPGRTAAKTFLDVIDASRRVRARLERRDPAVGTDLGWVTVAHETLPILGAAGSVVTWSGQLELPTALPPRTPGEESNWRVTVEEWEFLPADPLGVEQPGFEPRMIYADHFPL